MKKIDLALVTFEPMPFGMAATNRILTWTSAIVANGFIVSIYVVKPTEKKENIINKDWKGSYKNVNYYYLNKTTIWPKQANKIKKLIILLIGYINLMVQLIKDKPKVVVVYSRDIKVRLLLLLFRKILKYKYVIEETEYPRTSSKICNRLYKKLYLSLYHFVDGVLVISNELFIHYQKLRVKEVYFLPMTVDCSRFENIQKTTPEIPYFIYVGGSGGFVRDNVFDLVKAFNLFSKLIQDIQLLIVGPIDKKNNEFIQMQTFIENNDLHNRIFFLGSRPTFEIPALLVNALAIVMTPAVDFCSGGFPTKLGEFLASGTPVITTNVSEIAKYLDDSNSFLVKPGDVLNISEAMQYIYFHPKEANEIGLKGKNVANTTFNANTYVFQLINFLGLNINHV